MNLEKMTSKYEAQQLQRDVFIYNRIKTENETIYYNVDQIHTAIHQNMQIEFQYSEWNTKKELQFRRDGEYYTASPWSLTWDDENYYLVGFDSKSQSIKHYRVDKMLQIQMSEDEREGREYFQKLDMAEYTKKSFGMHGGKEQTVKLLVENDLAGVIIDRFGKDVMMIPVDQKHFSVHVNVRVSNHFLGWIISLGSGVKITGPEDVVERMKQEVKRLMDQYYNETC